MRGRFLRPLLGILFQEKQDRQAVPAQLDRRSAHPGQELTHDSSLGNMHEAIGHNTRQCKRRAESERGR